MTDIWLPNWLGVARASVSYFDSTGMSRNPYNGQVRTASMGGDKLRASIQLTPQGGASTQMERAAMIASLVRLRGKQNRLYLADSSNRLRGSFPATELLSNGTFPNGTTGWTGTSGETAISVQDRVLRSAKVSGHGSTSFALALSANVTVTQHAPYVVRFMARQGRGTYSSLVAWDQVAAAAMGSNVSTYGLITGAMVVTGTTIRPALHDNTTSGQLAGDYVNVSYASLSRCALVDNGPNSLLQSDAFGTTWTTTEATVNSNGAPAPDGTVSGDGLVDNANDAIHSVRQSITVPSAAGDYAFSVSLKRNIKTWAAIEFSDAATNSVVLYVNLATGVLGSFQTAGAGITNQRAYIAPEGDDWYRVTLVCRKTAAFTTLYSVVSSADSDLDRTYAGTAGNAIYMWRGSTAPSSLPLRGTQTTTTATTGTAQRGSALYAKGLPASASGLLLPGDQFEVITSFGSELKIVTSSLNSDAAGLGYLQFEPPLRGNPADNAPVIVHQPMGRFIFTGEYPEWLTEPGLVSTASLDLEEA